MLSFVETMSGTLGDTPISFTVCATRVAAGKFSLRGILSAPPLTQAEVEAHGTLHLALVPPAITYHLEFGDGLTLDAQKTPSPFSPWHSMTFMPTTVRDRGGKVVGEGSMRFEARDLPRFLASWLPRPRVQQRRLDARRLAVERSTLSRPS